MQCGPFADYDQTQSNAIAPASVMQVCQQLSLEEFVSFTLWLSRHFKDANYFIWNFFPIQIFVQIIEIHYQDIVFNPQSGLILKVF